MVKKGRCVKTIIVVTILMCIIAIILIIMSVHKLDYYQYGFKKHTTQNVVDRSESYGPGGMEFFGPGFGFLPLPATAQFVTFNNIMVFSKDRLEVSITAQMQYFLRKDQLALLHRRFDVNFETIINSNALSALKNKAPSFEVREFLRNRSLVEDELYLAIREHISGPCCEIGCADSLTCIPGCKSACEDSDYGFFVDVRYFQLNAVELPSGLKDKFLKTQVLYEEANIEFFIQEATVVRKETGLEIKQIDNEAREIRELARAESTLVISEATVNATATREQARVDGLQHLYTELDITSLEEKTSFDYLRTLGRGNNVKLAVNFEQLRLNG